MKALAFPLVAALALSACGSGDSGPTYGAMQVEDGSAMRFEAREAYAMLNRVCPYTQDAGKLAALEEQRARYDAVKEWVADKPLALDLASVEADYKFYWSANSFTCGETDTPESLAAYERDVALLQEKLSRMEELAGML